MSSEAIVIQIESSRGSPSDIGSVESNFCKKCRRRINQFSQL